MTNTASRESIRSSQGRRRPGMLNQFMDVTDGGGHRTRIHLTLNKRWSISGSSTASFLCGGRHFIVSSRITPSQDPIMAIYPLLSGTLLYETRTERGYRFRVERLLGQGGFGITYLANDLEFGVPCVVKEFALGAFCARNETTGSITAAPGQQVEYQRWLERFEREAQAIHRIRHPNVVGVRASWRERGTAYYAMDLVHGADELPSPDEDGWVAMPWERVERIATGMLNALAAVHEQGMVHGDIKPSNVLLDNNDRPVLIDFGTVRAQVDLTRTVTGAVYTPGYAPPELSNRSDLRDAGPWSDLYSWAMVVWGLVARHPSPDGRPLDASTRQIVMSSGGTDRYALPATPLESAGVPDSWVQVLVGCVQLPAPSRPQSVHAVFEAIRNSSSPAIVSPKKPDPAIAEAMPPSTASPTEQGHGGTPFARAIAQQDAVLDDEPLETVASNRKNFVWFGFIVMIALGAVSARSFLIDLTQGISGSSVSAEMLYGTWNVDFMRSLQSAEMSEEERAMAMALLGSSQMAITFDTAGNMTMDSTMMGENRTVAQSYRIISVGTNTLTVETTTPSEDGGRPTVEQGTITFDSPTAARIQPDDEQPLFITRAY